jgi:hypothetical protein
MTAFLLTTIVMTVVSAQQKPTTGYATVNGLKMYYEVHGSGEPVVLLHGAFIAASRLSVPEAPTTHSPSLEAYERRVPPSVHGPLGRADRASRLCRSTGRTPGLESLEAANSRFPVCHSDRRARGGG